MLKEPRKVQLIDIYVTVHAPFMFCSRAGSLYNEVMKRTNSKCCSIAHF
jgi:hypothetical protein